MKLSILATSTSLVATLALAPPARAHFMLTAPPSATAQDSQGNPQKAPGCGGGALNNVVTAVRAGDSIKVSWSETIYHPGHFRISLARTQAELSTPPVTGANCGQAAIMNPVAMPVLADGVNVKTTPTNLVYETTVKIPADFTCDRCLLQVVQFMSNHSEPCFYYHCAQLSVTAAGVGGASPNGTGAADASTTGLPAADDSAGGCSVGGRHDHHGAAFGLGFAGVIGGVLGRVRRRRAPRPPTSRR